MLKIKSNNQKTTNKMIPFFPNNKFILQSIIPLIVILQTNFRRKKQNIQYTKIKKSILLIQKKVKKKLLTNQIILPKTQYKKYKTNNKYFSIFINIELLVIDIQKNIRRMLIQKKQKNTRKIYFLGGDETDKSTEYSSEEEEWNNNLNNNLVEKLFLFFTKYIINDSEKLNTKIDNIPKIIKYIENGRTTIDILQKHLFKIYGYNLNDI